MLQRAAELAKLGSNDLRMLLAEARKLVEGRGSGAEAFLDACEHVAMLWGVIDERWRYFAKILLLLRIYREVGKELRELRDFEANASYQAIRLVYSRYLLRDESGRVRETPNEMLWRTALFVAMAEARYGGDPRSYASRFFELMAQRRFFPNSPTLMNAATRRPQLAACFVVPLEDDTNAILEAARVAALIMKTGAGVGFDFSRLRPRGDIVAGTGGRSSGPVSFMKLFDSVAEVIKEGGKRRGAMMAILHCWHPDVLEFIESKCGKLGVLENFNLSVAVHDVFMEKALRGDKWCLYNPRTCEHVRDPLSEDLELSEKLCKAEICVNASEVLRRAAECAWRCGDPGLVFVDTINKHNPTPKLGRIHSTNPCGETPLLGWEACNLGSINLRAYVSNGRILWDELARDVETAIRFLDDVIDMSWYPDPRIEEAVRRTRKVGLGVMGFADMLAELGVAYDSHDALYLADKVAEFVAYHARKASNELARERGSYPEFRHSIHAEGRFNWEPQVPAHEIYDESKVSPEVRKLVDDRPAIDWEKLREEMRKGTRNATVTTIAPTGSISILAGVNSGIEPFFALVYVRESTIGRFIEVNGFLRRYLAERGLLDKNVLLRIARGDKSVLGEDMRRVLRTAHEIEPEWHVRMQAVFQRWVDNAVSKTVNMRYDASVEEVRKVFVLAWRLGCKGITVFRDRSRPTQVLSLGEELEKILRTIPERHKHRDKYVHRWIRTKHDELIAVVEEYAGGCPACDL